MPSVMDTIKWRDKWIRLSAPMRNTIITDTVAWLESEQRPRCRPEHLTHLVNFENDLQSLLNQQKIQDGWFGLRANTYGSFPFFAAFIHRIL